jgi:excisionase family DNA binding protein
MTDRDVRENQRFLSVRQLAKRWQISMAHGYRMAGTEIPALRIGGAVRIPLDAVEAFERKQLGRVPADRGAA